MSPTEVSCRVLEPSEVHRVLLVDGLGEVSPLTHSVQQLPGGQLVPPLVHTRSNGRKARRSNWVRLVEILTGRGVQRKYYDPKYVAGLHSHTVGLGQATQGSVFGQEAILQIYHSLPDLLVFGQHVVVVNHHPKVLLQREGAGELEHPATEA